MDGTRTHREDDSLLKLPNLHNKQCNNTLKVLQDVRKKDYRGSEDKKRCETKTYVKDHQDERNITRQKNVTKKT